LHVMNESETGKILVSLLNEPDSARRKEILKQIVGDNDLSMSCALIQAFEECEEI